MRLLMGQRNEERDMPTFHTTVTIEYTDNLGREREHEVEVTYTFDGGRDDVPTIIEQRGDCFNGWDDDIADELVWDALCDTCDRDYAEWLADQGDYLLEQRRDAQMDKEMGQ